MPDIDLALETLLAVKADIAPDLDDDLLKRCYALQKKHQFDHDRGPSTQAMDRLIDECVQKALPEQSR
jgi:hypothetical protein